MPRSYSALVARGIYLRYLGKQARGSAYIEDTPRQQIEIMSTYLARAMRDYNASLTLTKKPLLTHHSIIAVTMLDAMVGGDALASRMLNESLRVDPRISSFATSTSPRCQRAGAAACRRCWTSKSRRAQRDSPTLSSDTLRTCSSRSDVGYRRAGAAANRES